MWQASKSSRIDRLVVFCWLNGGYIPAGELTFEGAGKQRFGRFTYALSYLARDEKRPLDPIGLPLARKSFAAAPEEVPLVFHDVGPDGWGKQILRRAFPLSVLTMPEYLALGGLERTGDIAFGPTPERPGTWTPPDEPLIDLPTERDDLEALMAAAEAVDAGNATKHHFQLLFRKSADIGGARPKARIRHEGKQWIAKFSANDDAFNEPRVEAACLDVAEAAGFPVPPRKIVAIGTRAALLVQRFDRGANGQPFSYVSAATLLKQPSIEYNTERTYLDIAVAAQQICVKNARKEAFGRLLLNAYLHNTDDHLRNHAFINDGNGWKLAPVFDLVPHPLLRRHVCAPAAGMSPAWDANLAFEAHKHFKIPTPEAESLREDIVRAARRLPEFMDQREVVADDRKILKDALPKEIRL